MKRFRRWTFILLTALSFALCLGWILSWINVVMWIGNGHSHRLCVAAQVNQLEVFAFRIHGPYVSKFDLNGHPFFEVNPKTTLWDIQSRLNLTTRVNNYHWLLGDVWGLGAWSVDNDPCLEEASAKVYFWQLILLTGAPFIVYLYRKIRRRFD